MDTVTLGVIYVDLGETNRLLREVCRGLAPFIEADQEAARLRQELLEHGRQVRTALLSFELNNPQAEAKTREETPDLFAVNDVVLEAKRLLDRLESQNGSSNGNGPYPYSGGSFDQPVPARPTTPVPSAPTPQSAPVNGSPSTQQAAQPLDQFTSQEMSDIREILRRKQILMSVADKGDMIARVIGRTKAPDGLVSVAKRRNGDSPSTDQDRKPA